MSTTHRWRAFGVLAIGYFMTIVDLTIVNVALPTIGRDLQFSESDLQWVVTAYGLTFGGLLLLGGRTADLLGRRRIFMVGMSLFTAASLACGLSQSSAELILMRALQGTGAALVLPAALSLVLSLFPEGAERNKALGVWGALGAGGGHGRADHRRSPHPVRELGVRLPAQHPRGTDGAGTGLPRGSGEPASVQHPSVRRARWHGRDRGPAARGLRDLHRPRGGVDDSTEHRPDGSSRSAPGCLPRHREGVAEPLLPLGVLRSRSVAGANLVGFALGGSFYAFLFVGTLYMQQVLGFSALQTGLAWLTTSLMSVALAGLAQLLTTRIGAGRVMVIGMALIAGGIAWATQVPVDGHFSRDLLGPLLVTGAGTAFGFIPVSVAGLTGVAQHQAGVASGLLNTARSRSAEPSVSRSPARWRPRTQRRCSLTAPQHARRSPLASTGLSGPAARSPWSPCRSASSFRARDPPTSGNRAFRA